MGSEMCIRDRQEAATALLQDAGFADVEALPAKGDPMNALYVATG